MVLINSILDVQLLDLFSNNSGTSLFPFPFIGLAIVPIFTTLCSLPCDWRSWGCHFGPEVLGVSFIIVLVYIHECASLTIPKGADIDQGQGSSLRVVHWSQDHCGPASPHTQDSATILFTPDMIDTPEVRTIMGRCKGPPLPDPLSSIGSSVNRWRVHFSLKAFVLTLGSDWLLNSTSSHWGISQLGFYLKRFP